MPDEVIPSTDGIRFTYETDGAGALILVDAVPVSMTAFPSDDLDPDLAPFRGFWFELRDAGGALLWRHVTQHPLRGTVEIYSDEQPGLLDDDVGAPVASVAIPALAGADTVALMGSPAAEPDGEVVELLTHRFEAFVV